MNHTKPLEIVENIYFIGAFDPDIRTFDIIMKTANGSSYNAYLIKTFEGVIIVDTVKLEFQRDFFSKIEQLLKDGVNSNDIAILTYTNADVLNLYYYL